MGEEDIWRVSDLLDEKHQPFAEDVKLARQMISTYNELRSLNSDRGRTGPGMWDNIPDVRVPRQAIEFMENTLSEWFEVVAEIEVRRGNMPYLIDRGLYPEGQIDWNQGLKISDIQSWMDGSYMGGSGSGIGDYPFMPPMALSS